MDLVVAEMNAWTISLALAFGMLAAWRIGIGWAQLNSKGRRNRTI